MMKPRFFRSPEAFRSWLEKNHDSAKELWVGYYKKGTGRPSIDWPQSVDQALCFGWIDGLRKSVDDERYMNRFTPRRAKSNWSAVNIKRVRELKKLGLMKPAGLKAFEAKDPKRSERYSFERVRPAFSRVQLEMLRKNRKAWSFFQSQPPSYRKLATWWVISAMKDETRMRRLRTLIRDSEAGLRIAPMRRPQR